MFLTAEWTVSHSQSWVALFYTSCTHMFLTAEWKVSHSQSWVALFYTSWTHMFLTAEWKVSHSQSCGSGMEPSYLQPDGGRPQCAWDYSGPVWQHRGLWQLSSLPLLWPSGRCWWGQLDPGENRCCLFLLLNMDEREMMRWDVLLNKPMVHFKGGNIWKTHEAYEKDASKTNETAIHTTTKIYSSVHFSFIPSLAHWFISYSATALINLPSHSLNHIIHRLTYKVSETLSQYTNQLVITDFGQLHLELACSTYPKLSNQKYNSPFIHQVTLSLV